MTIPPKERKFVECFKSNRDGSCNYCKTRSWNTGNKIYAMKKPDGHWIACTDKKCYLEQGGKLTLFSGEPLANPVIEDIDVLRIPYHISKQHLESGYWVARIIEVPEIFVLALEESKLTGKIQDAFRGFVKAFPDKSLPLTDTIEVVTFEKTYKRDSK